MYPKMLAFFEPPNNFAVPHLENGKLSSQFICVGLCALLGIAPLDNNIWQNG